MSDFCIDLMYASFIPGNQANNMHVVGAAFMKNGTKNNATEIKTINSQVLCSVIEQTPVL